MGVMLRGCSSCDWSSSLTLAISWRGNIGYESARNRWAEKFVGSVLTDFQPSTSAKLLEAEIAVYAASWRYVPPGPNRATDVTDRPLGYR